MGGKHHLTMGLGGSPRLTTMLFLRWKRSRRSSGYKAFFRDSVQELHHVRIGWGQLPPRGRWPGTEPPHLWLLPAFRAFLTHLYPTPSQEKKLLSSANSSSLGSIHLLCINSSNGHHHCHQCCHYHHHHHLLSMSCVSISSELTQLIFTQAWEIVTVILILLEEMKGHNLSIPL